MPIRLDSETRAKKAAKRLHSVLEGYDFDVTLSWCKDTVARMLAYRDWFHLRKDIGAGAAFPFDFELKLEERLSRQAFQAGVLSERLRGKDVDEAADCQQIVARVRPSDRPDGNGPRASRTDPLFENREADRFGDPHQFGVGKRLEVTDRSSALISASAKFMEATLAERARMGPCYHFAWDIESVMEKARGGGRDWQSVREMTWNPLSAAATPAAGPARDEYVRLITETLCTDIHFRDRFWTNRASKAAFGIISLVLARADRFVAAAEREKPCGEVIENTSLPAAADLVSGLAGAFERSENFQHEIIQEWIDEICDIDNRNEEMLGCRLLEAARNELVTLRDTPRLTLSSIVITLNEFLEIFRHPLVRSWTSEGTFSFDVLRGVREFAGDWRPVSIYIDIALENSKPLRPLVKLFATLANTYLEDHPAGSKGSNGRTIGPFDCGFIADE